MTATATAKRPLQVGLLLPIVEGMHLGKMARWRDLADFAQAAEDAGFDSLWVGDHFLYRFPGLPSMGVWECWSLVSALAAVTERIQIGTMVTVTPWRTPGLLAKIVDAVDEISNGRLILGVGAGSHEAEFPAFGYGSWPDRVSRFEEEIQILRSLLTTGRADHSGRYHSLQDCELRPRGPREKGPRIMIGARGRRMVELAARFGDEWNIPWRHQVDDVRAEISRGAEACSAVGRDPATLDHSVSLQVDLPNRDDYPGSELLRQGRAEALRGDPGEIADTLRDYAESGVDHVQLWLDPSSAEGVSAAAEILAELISS